MNLYHDMRKNITVLGKNGSLWSQNAYKELFLLAEGRSTLNVISLQLVSINFMKHKKEDIQFYILLPYSLKMLNLHICASSEWFSVISNQVIFFVDQALLAGRNLYRATHAVTWGLSFSSLIRRTAPFSRLLQLVRGCIGPILTRIPTVHCYGHMIMHNICTCI
jgi:hypothetical protein